MFKIGGKAAAWLGLVLGIGGTIANAPAAVGEHVAGTVGSAVAIVGTVLAALGVNPFARKD